jgi:hypothetical protein
VYGREIDGQLLNLGVSGKLIMNAMVMYDRETDSLWSQFLGKAVDGPMKGRTLELIPSQLTNYGSWTGLHPNTLVLDTGSNTPVEDHYVPYYFGPAAGIIGEENPDERLYGKELVVGVVGKEGEIAYNYRDLLETPVLNQVFEDVAIVVAVDPDAGGTAIYRSEVDGQALTFEDFDEGSMTDVQTKSVWDKTSGRAVSGPMLDSQLEAFPYILSFWFAWSDFYPNTLLYEPPEEG